MKFTTEEAREKLTSILTNNGKKTLRMSLDSVDRQLETLMPIIANDDMELDDFVEKVRKSFEVMNSNAEHDNSTFVKQWKESHPDVKPSEHKQSKNDESHKDDEDKFGDLLKRIDELEKSEKEAKLKNALDNKRGELLKAIEDKGVKNKEWSKAMANMVNVTEDMDVDKEAEQCIALFNIQKSSSDDFTPLGSSSGTQKNKDTLDKVKNFRKQSGLSD